MTIPSLDELDRGRFAWPEPLLIELISDQYADRVAAAQRLAAAKLHEKALRAVMEERAADGANLRGRLTAFHAANGLGHNVMAEIDNAVFFELTRLVGVRFRHSPRLRDAYTKHLSAALSQSVMAGTPVVARLTERQSSATTSMRAWRRLSTAAHAVSG